MLYRIVANDYPGEEGRSYYTVETSKVKFLGIWDPVRRRGEFGQQVPVRFGSIMKAKIWIAEDKKSRERAKMAALSVPKRWVVYEEPYGDLEFRRSIR